MAARVAAELTDSVLWIPTEYRVFLILKEAAADARQAPGCPGCGTSPAATSQPTSSSSSLDGEMEAKPQQLGGSGSNCQGDNQEEIPVAALADPGPSLA
jgi:hypothetical protein